MKKIITLFLLFVTLASGTSAQGLKGKMKKLLGKDKSEQTALVQLPVPYQSIDNRIVLANASEFENSTDETVFVNAMLYMQTQGEKGKSNIRSMNNDQRWFCMDKSFIINPDDEKATYYVCVLRFQIADKILNICADSIYVVTSNIFGDVKATPFEKLNLQKEKAVSQLNEMSEQYKLLVDDLSKFILVNEPQAVTHWSDIVAQNVVEGMNETECILGIGVPKFVRNNGLKTRWIMENNVTIMFEKGQVVKVIK